MAKKSEIAIPCWMCVWHDEEFALEPGGCLLVSRRKRVSVELGFILGIVVWNEGTTPHLAVHFENFHFLSHKETLHTPVTSDKEPPLRTSVQTP